MTARHWRILFVLMAAEIVSAFETSMVLAGLASWIRIFGDPIGVGWIVTAYMLVGATAAALCGRLGDMFGRKRMLIIVVVIAMIGSVISAVGPTLGWIVAGRAIQGFAGAIIPLCYGLVREHLPAERVPLGVGMIVATAAAASALGLLLGGVLTDLHGPNSIFVASAATAAIVALVLVLLLPGSPRNARPGKIDWLGGLLFAPAVTVLLLLFSNLREWGALSPLSIGAFLLGTGTLLLWYFHEKRQADPLIDVRLLANRNCLIGNLVMVCAAAGVMQFTQLTALLLQQPTWTGAGLGTSATFVGLVKFPAVAAGLVSSIWAGWASGRFGARLPMLLGCLTMAAASTLAVFEHHSVLIIVIVVTVANMGVTAVYTGIPNIIIAASPPERTAEATGLMAVVRAMSQAIGAQLLAIILAVSTVTSPDGKAFPAEASYQLAFAMMAAFSIIGFLLSLMLGRRQATAAETAAVA